MPLTLDDLRSGRVKLIFGDPEQCAVLEAERKRQEELEKATKGKKKTATAIDDPTKEKIYSVEIEGSFSVIIDVEAFDEDEAHQKAKADWRSGDVDFDVEHVQTESVKLKG